MLEMKNWTLPVDIMQCENCKKNTATIHLTEIVDSRRAELHLCEPCAQKHGLAVKAQMPLNELLTTLLAAQPQPEAAIDADSENLVCPYCGITLEKFLKNSILGCPHDYVVFEKSLLPIIERSHAGRTTHCGKVPSKASSDTKKQAELLALKKKLEAAVRSENYETAAELRDKINRLQKSFTG